MKGSYEQTIRKKLSLGIIIILIFMMTGCGSRDNGSLGGVATTKQAAVESRDSAATAENSSYQNSTMPKKMSNQWTFELEVQDSRQANAGIIARTEELQGYLVESRISTEEDQVKANLVVKIPDDKAHVMLDYLEKLGYVKEEKKASRDVSDDYYDTEARLKVLVAEEERLLTFMQNKTATIQDLLAVEKEVARVRQDRESLQARMNLLNNQVDYTSFTISLSENQTALKTPKGTMGKAGQGFISSLGLLLQFINGFFIVLITLLPFLIVLGGILYLILRWHRRRKGNKTKKVQETAGPIYAPGYQPPDENTDDQP